MKRYHFLGWMLAVLMSVSGPALAAGEQGHPVVGTWLITVMVAEPYDILMTLHSDGTVLLSQSTADFAGGCTAASTRQGVWEKDGPLGLIGTHLGFVYQADPEVGCGAFVAYQLFRWTAQIRRDDPDTADARLYVDVYPAGSDPLDPMSMPAMQVGPVDVLARRIPLMAPPEE